VALDALGDWLRAAPPGQAAALFGATAADARAALAAAEAPGRRLGVVFPLDALAPGEAVAEQGAAALAAAALAAFPYWYGSDVLIGLGAGTLDNVLLDSRLRDLHPAILELSPRWARRAVARARAGRPPRDPDLPLAIQLRQLALALDPAPLTLIPALSRAPGPIEATALAQALEWLARGAGAAVVALLPGTAREVAELRDRMPCADLLVTDPSAASDDAMAAAPWVGPIEGRPHWASPAEQRLAAALTGDADLGPLFAFNQPVTTRRGGRPRVDLLWDAGRLVVEIDGYADHATRAAFRRDRQRDYELAISGYLVVRLTAEEVLMDVQLSLDKVRDAVNFRRGNNTAMPA
jgi:very-short-patch-repair endonuclease